MCVLVFCNKEMELDWIDLILIYKDVYEGNFFK